MTVVHNNQKPHGTSSVTLNISRYRKKNPGTPTMDAICMKTFTQRHVLSTIWLYIFFVLWTFHFKLLSWHHVYNVHSPVCDRSHHRWKSVLEVRCRLQIELQSSFRSCVYTPRVQGKQDRKEYTPSGSTDIGVQRSETTLLEILVNWGLLVR